MKSQLGIVVDTVSEDLAAALTRISAWGIRNVELYHLWHKAITDLTEAELAEAGRLIAASGARVTNIASLVMRCAPTDAAEAENLEIFARAVGAARALGTDRVRCYAYLKQPDLDTLWPRLMRTYDRLLRLAEARDVTLLLENSSYANLQTTAELRRFLDAVDHPRLQLLWDAGNAFALGDPTPTVEAWHTLKDRIVHLHLKDSVAHGSNQWTAVGAGGLDLDGLLKAVAADGYTGVVSLETYFDDATSRLDLIDQSVHAVRAALGRVGLA